MSFRWISQEPDDASLVADLANQLNITHTLASLLILRGITTFEKARRFFRPNLNELHDPFLMKDMDKGANRLAQAVRKSETVVVYGDYDVDGTTATAIMYSFLKEFGCKVLYYIPHRFKEGYGISEDGIEYAINQKADLIVSVDCGITAIHEAEIIKNNGIDLIICDHHNTDDQIPDAFAVLDPKRPDCNYPFDGLSGAGVGFKLVQATIQKLGLPADHTYKYLDLLAISIASDIVPIIDENRILMREGLKLLNQNPRPGIQALLNLVNLKSGMMNTSKIVFSIGPRINAAGRLGDAKTAVELLIAETEEEGHLRATELESINLKRRQIDSNTMECALEMIGTLDNMEEISGLVLHNPDWNIGVIGIVASRLVDKFYRPTIMLSTVDGMAKGSARSIRGFNVYNALKECEDLLIQFGGHEFAAGLTLLEDDVAKFQRRFNDIVSNQLSEQDFEPELYIESELHLSEITSSFWTILRQFEPFGPLNMKPIFVSKGITITSTPTIVGNGHLKFRVKQDNSTEYEVIGFNMHDYLPKVRDSRSGQLNLAYVLDENTWHNQTTIQLRLKDIH